MARIQIKEPLSESSMTLSVHVHHIDALSLNKTPKQLFHLRLQRDVAKVKAFTSMATKAITLKHTQAIGSGSGFSSSVTSGLTQGNSEYFTRLGSGTPPRYMYMVLDTESDIVWLQCSPCRKCYSQTNLVFNWMQSRSFAKISCGSPLCCRLDSPGCN